jgi:electron transfer flavoprotein beta subunit
MNILVCISHVPDTTTRITFEPNGKSLNKAGVTFVINPYDEFGLSKAMEFKEKSNDVHISVICVGDIETEPTLRKALAIGADDAFRIDTQPLDSFSVATLISDWARDKSFDLIFTGKESIDENAGAVPGMLAELLGVSFISYATKLDINGNSVIGYREIDNGMEILEAQLPLLVSCQKGIAEWRIPNMRGIMAARSKPLTVINALQVENRVITLNFKQPEGKTGCVYYSSDNPEELISVLSTKGII